MPKSSFYIFELANLNPTTKEFGEFVFSSTSVEWPETTFLAVWPNQQYIYTYVRW